MKCHSPHLSDLRFLIRTIKTFDTKIVDNRWYVIYKCAYDQFDLGEFHFHNQTKKHGLMLYQATRFPTHHWFWFSCYNTVEAETLTSSRHVYFLTKKRVFMLWSCYPLLTWLVYVSIYRVTTVLFQKFSMAKYIRVFPSFTGPDRPDRIWDTFVQGSIFVSMIICVYLHQIRRRSCLICLQWWTLHLMYWWLSGLGCWEVRGRQTGSQTGSCLPEGSSVWSPIAPSMFFSFFMHKIPYKHKWSLKQKCFLVQMCPRSCQACQTLWIKEKLEGKMTDLAAHDLWKNLNVTSNSEQQHDSQRITDSSFNSTTLVRTSNRQVFPKVVSSVTSVLSFLKAHTCIE